MNHLHGFAAIGVAFTVAAGLADCDPPDTTPPDRPANLVVSDLVCDEVTLSWTASNDDVGVTGYDLYHDGQFITSVDGDTLSERFEVEPGTRWGLYVNARDAAGNVSTSSESVPITPPRCSDDTEAPTSPTDVEATTTGTSVSLRWTASSDDVGVRAYDVVRDGERVGSVTGTAAEPPASSFTDSGLDADTAYAYAVEARDAQGNVSTQSEAIEVTTGASCDGAVCSVEEIAQDDDLPWGLTTLPDGSVLYNRRDAHDIVRLEPDTGEQTSIGTVPNVEGTDGEGGLTGLAVSADFATDRWLYVMHSSPTDNRVVRIRYEGGELQTDTEEILLDGIERARFHDGGRLRFGPDGNLYVATGDAENDTDAQDTDSLNGKILRIEPDGGVPADNPFGNEVWSYGHRNPQGLAFDSEGRLWQQEFGNSEMDETNHVVKGGNYGWPACEGTLGNCDDPDFIAPKATYSNDQASCSGIAIVDDALYIACLRGERMYRHVIDGTELTDRKEFFNGTYGRLRTVEPTAGGGLWLTTSDGDKDSTAENSDTKILRVTLGS